MLYWKFCSSDISMLLAGIPGFWTLSITAILDRTQCFRKMGIFVLRLKGWETAFV